MEADEMENDPFDMVQEILNSDHYTSGEKECVKFPPPPVNMIRTGTSIPRPRS